MTLTSFPLFSYTYTVKFSPRFALLQVCSAQKGLLCFATQTAANNLNLIVFSVVVVDVFA